MKGQQVMENKRYTYFIFESDKPVYLKKENLIILGLLWIQLVMGSLTITKDYLT